MSVEQQLGREHHTRRRHAALRQLTQQVGLGLRVPRQHPQNPAGSAAHDARPRVEHLGRQLVRLVEAAQHQCVFGQAAGRAPRRRGPRALPVVGLVRARHLRDLFAEVRGVRERRDHRVADHVVDVVGTGRAGKPEPAHLHRRRPRGQQLEAAVARMALQVDEDVDAVGANALAGGSVAEVRHVDEVVAGGHHASAQGRTVVAAVRIQKDLEAARVAPLEQLGHQHRRGVVVEVAGQIAEANAARRTLLGQGRQARHGVAEHRRAPAADTQLLGGRAVDRQERERAQQPAAGRVVQGARGLAQCARVVGQLLPLAGLAALLHQQREREDAHAAIVERHRGAKALRRLHLHVQVLEGEAHVVVHQRVVDLQRERPEEDGDRVAQAVAVQQRHAVRSQQVVVARCGRVELFEAGHRLGVAVLLDHALGEQAGSEHAAAVEVERFACRVGSGRVLLEAGARAREVQPIDRFERRQRRGAGEFAHRRRPALRLAVRDTGVPVLLCALGMACGGLRFVHGWRDG